jgi:hypothetical protein
MSGSPNGLPKSLKIGSLLVMLAGSVPFVVASVLFVAFLISDLNPSHCWLSGQVPPGCASYSLNDIRGFNPELATDFVTAQHIELVNVINTGFVIVILAIFGLRRYQKWSWYTILATFLWVGLNDAFALYMAHEPPIPLIPEVVGMIGLFVARRPIFKPV